MKLFVREKGTEALISMIEAIDDGHKLVSSIASLEVRSAIRRRVRNGDILPEYADLALDSLSVESRRLVEHPVTAQVLEVAREVIDRHLLRSLDSIQLATCIVGRDALRVSDVCFVASDAALLRAAVVERFEIFNPEHEE